MSDEPNPPSEPEREHSRESERDDDDDPAMRALLKRSLAKAVEPPPILPGVQKKLRERSRGKFYGDGWSTSQGRLTYVLAAAITLALAVVAYLALGPHGFAR